MQIYFYNTLLKNFSYKLFDQQSYFYQKLNNASKYNLDLDNVFLEFKIEFLMDKNFYITTPIYYPSAKPHMGHAYSSIVSDFFARLKKIQGYDVFFLTGTDEHGQKIQRAAESKGKDPIKFCDEISKTFKDLCKTLNLSNNDFIRTTEDRHKKSVEKSLEYIRK